VSALAGEWSASTPDYAWEWENCDSEARRVWGDGVFGYSNDVYCAMLLGLPARMGKVTIRHSPTPMLPSAVGIQRTPAYRVNA